MPRCKSCGKEIDDYQYQQFKGKCSDCVRVKKAGKSDAIGWGAFFVIMGLLALVAGIFLTFQTQSFESIIFLGITSCALLTLGGFLILYGRK
ncbi:MAG: hypothetical protein EU529_10660 [Promethearchaeota archaeon]|nr:MAG: hypothetical protein EU529_10660 [Candidatus Lokiarchaeota archaeon]